jgi:hypothetical protein
MPLNNVDLYRVDGSLGSVSNIQTAAINGGPIAGSRNRIINGDMRIDQRNAGASVTPTTDASYTLDRWNARLSAASKFSVQQTTASNPSDFPKAMGVTSLAATSLAASDFYAVSQVIEGFNISDLAWGTSNAKTVTLSFWARSSLTGTFGGSLRNAATNRSYPFTYTISAANTWEQKSITIAGDTTGTWASDNSAALYLFFGLGVGSTYSGTAGSWSANNFLSSTGTTSVVGTNGATFYITGVQLEPGTVATPFERRSFGAELALCQRYFVSASINVSPSSWNSTPYYFPVTMRATPTVTGTGAGYTVAGSATNSGIYHYQNSFGISTVNAAIEL